MSCDADRLSANSAELLSRARRFAQPGGMPMSGAAARRSRRRWRASATGSSPTGERSRRLRGPRTGRLQRHDIGKKQGHAAAVRARTRAECGDDGGFEGREPPPRDLENASGQRRRQAIPLRALQMVAVVGTPAADTVDEPDSFFRRPDSPSGACPETLRSPAGRGTRI